MGHGPTNPAQVFQSNHHCPASGPTGLEAMLNARKYQLTALSILALGTYLTSGGKHFCWMPSTPQDQNTMGTMDADMTSCHAAMWSTTSAPDNTLPLLVTKEGRIERVQQCDKHQQDGDCARNQTCLNSVCITRSRYGWECRSPEMFYWGGAGAEMANHVKSPR